MGIDLSGYLLIALAVDWASSARVAFGCYNPDCCKVEGFGFRVNVRTSQVLVAWRRSVCRESRDLGRDQFIGCAYDGLVVCV